MADPKDQSFFRKVVRFVANPTTDWADLGNRAADDSTLEVERSELKAMVERKRRNDFVRKREFDVLRKLRREGLSPEQLAALGGSSRIDDSESRASEQPPTQRGGDIGVKAKIDEIEQQMVGNAGRRPATAPPASSQRRAPGLFDLGNPAPTAMPPAATTMPAVMEAPAPAAMPPSPAAGRAPLPPASPPRLDTRVDDRGGPTTSGRAVMGPGLPPLSRPAAPAQPEWPPRAPLSASAPTAPSPVAAPPLPALPSTDFGGAFAVEVSEAVHDPELDEAVIAFANADFDQCEQSLSEMTAPAGPRVDHAETWLVLFDFYRATGQQHKFEQFALDYAQRFGWSSPQWFSMPRQVAEAAAAADDRPATLRQSAAGEVGWVAPERLDAEAVARLRSQTLQMPLPWVFDWSALRAVDAEAATQLSALFKQWAEEPLDMRWRDGERFLQVLAEAAPNGGRDADPAFWLCRLDALRLANRADQFDEVAIDYCVTYEVSPPSWERVRCTVRYADSLHSTQSPPLSQISEVSTSFLESGLLDDAHGVQVATVELSGQLVGDIGPTLMKLDEQLGQATLVTVNCGKLIRVDFIAAGDLLNWVLAKRSEHREVVFVDAHRLVALFFGAMGINEHARVKVRSN